MSRLLHAAAALTILWCAAALHGSGVPERWLFEGLITVADPALAPDLQSGWVLSGSFGFAGAAMEQEIAPDARRGGRLSGGITDAELTVDLYYQIHFEARQAPGMAGIDYRDNGPEDEGGDLLGWFFPMRGQLKETGWSSRWLQIWLTDPSGRMIRSVPPRIPANGLEWKEGWFRLTFVNAEGKTVVAEGQIELFAPERNLPAQDSAAGWKAVANELGARLHERDNTLAALRADFEQTRARMESLRRMVDLLVEERAYLEQENARLQQAAGDGSEAAAALAALVTDKAMLELEMAGLSSRNSALAASLAESEQETTLLRLQLREIEAAAQAGAPEAVQARTHDSVAWRDGQPAARITIVEEPMVIERPVPVQPAAIAAIAAEAAPEAPPPRTRRAGPRLFR